MSAVCILTPAIIAGWPAISAAVAGAATSMGIAVVRESAVGVRKALAARVACHDAVELTIEDCEVVAEGLAAEEQIVLAKGDVTLRVFRNARGKCKVVAEGKSHSRQELRELGEQLVEKMTQVYVYNKVMTELKNRGFTVIAEEVGEDEAVHIHVRQQMA